MWTVVSVNLCRWNMQYSIQAMCQLLLRVLFLLSHDEWCAAICHLRHSFLSLASWMGFQLDVVMLACLIGKAIRCSTWIHWPCGWRFKCLLLAVHIECIQCCLLVFVGSSEIWLRPLCTCVLLCTDLLSTFVAMTDFGSINIEMDVCIEYLLSLGSDGAQWLAGQVQNPSPSGADFMKGSLDWHMCHMFWFWVYLFIVDVSGHMFNVDILGSLSHSGQFWRRYNCPSRLERCQRCTRSCLPGVSHSAHATSVSVTEGVVKRCSSVEWPIFFAMCDVLCWVIVAVIPFTLDWGTICRAHLSFFGKRQQRTHYLRPLDNNVLLLFVKYLLCIFMYVFVCEWWGVFVPTLAPLWCHVYLCHAKDRHVTFVGQDERMAGGQPQAFGAVQRGAPDVAV